MDPSILFGGHGHAAPHLIRGYQEEFQTLLYSRLEFAMGVPCSIAPGFGILPVGTLVAPMAAGRTHLWVPYALARPPVNDPNFFALPILADTAAGTAAVEVEKVKSYRFAVGDELALADNANYSDQGSGAVDLGAITAIDRTTYPHKAVVTVTNAAGAVYAVSDGAAIFHKTAAATPFTKARALLYGGAQTGESADAAGAQAFAVLSNFVVYHTGLKNLDDTAVADMSAEKIQNMLIVR